MKTVIIVRFNSNDKQTLGRCYVRDESGAVIFEACSLERGWLNNAPNVSCVPAGSFSMEYEYSPKFDRRLWELKEVPNRSETKFHTANFWHELNGCIALGDDHTDINEDGYIDVKNSKKTMDLFHSVMTGNRAILIIIQLFTREVNGCNV